MAKSLMKAVVEHSLVKLEPGGFLEAVAVVLILIGMGPGKFGHNCLRLVGVPSLQFLFERFVTLSVSNNCGEQISSGTYVVGMKQRIGQLFHGSTTFIVFRWPVNSTVCRCPSTLLEICS